MARILLLFTIVACFLYNAATTAAQDSPQQSLFDGLSMMRKVARLSSIGNFPPFRSSSSELAALWRAILPMCTLLDQRDEIAKTQFGNNTAEIEAVTTIVDGFINDTCDWVRFKLMVNATTYPCSSEATPKLKSLCVQMRLHDLSENLANSLRFELYPDQISYRYNSDRRWVERKFSGQPEDARASLPVLASHRSFARCRINSVTHSVRC